MLAALAKRLGAHLGLQPLPSWEQELAYKLRTLSAERATTVEDLMSRLDADPTLMREVSAALTVNETYFFREMRQFEAALAHIVPRAEREPVRVWSAGCSSGEEPYSLAILLARQAGHVQSRVHIRASDISSACLEKARRGIYGPWSFRSAPAWLRSDYFNPVGKSAWRLDPHMRQRVEFYQETIQTSLARIPAASIDVIFFRNVSIYTEPTVLAKIFAGFHRALKPDGWLVQSVSDVVPPHEPFESVPGTVLGIYTPRQHAESLPVHRVSSMAGAPDAFLLETLRKRRTRDVRIMDAPATEPGQPVMYSLAQNTPPANPRLTSSTSGADRAELLRLAKENANAGNLEQALEYTDRVLAAAPDHVAARFLRGQVLLASGLSDQAVNELRKVVFLSPAHLLGRYWLATAFLRIEMPRRAALEFAELSRRLMHTDPDELLEDGTTPVEELRAAVDAQQRTLQ